MNNDYNEIKNWWKKLTKDKYSW